MHALDKRHTAESEGLLGISTMASTIDWCFFKIILFSNSILTLSNDRFSRKLHDGRSHCKLPWISRDQKSDSQRTTSINFKSAHLTKIRKSEIPQINR